MPTPKTSPRQYGDKYVQASEEERRAALVAYALPKNIQGLHDDLARYRVEYDNWFKESSLHENGAVGRVVELLKEKGATYEKEGATWFHGEAYGSEDFVLVRGKRGAHLCGAGHRLSLRQAGDPRLRPGH